MKYQTTLCPNCHSRHNVNYWRLGDYLGLGAGAHSYLQIGVDPIAGKRWSNEKNPGRYMARINRKRVLRSAERENIDRDKAAGEFLVSRFKNDIGSFVRSISFQLLAGLRSSSIRR